MAEQSFFPYLPDFGSLPTKSLSSSRQTIQNHLRGGDKEAAGDSTVGSKEMKEIAGLENLPGPVSEVSDNEAEAYSVGSTSQVCAKFDF